MVEKLRELRGICQAKKTKKVRVVDGRSCATPIIQPPLICFPSYLPMRLRHLICHFCLVDLDDIPHLPAIGSSLLNQRQSLQLGRRIPAYLIYPTAVSNQQ